MESTHDLDFVLWCLEPAKPVRVYSQVNFGAMRDAGATQLGEMDQYTAPIRSIGAALDQLLGRHAIEDLGDPRLLHDRHAGERADAEALDIAEAGEHPPFGDAEVPGFQRVVELARDDMARASEQIGEVILGEAVMREIARRANLAEHCIKKVETLEFHELGMEAIWRIEVENFPAFIVIDDKGNDFFQELNLG